MKIWTSASQKACEMAAGKNLQDWGELKQMYRWSRLIHWYTTRFGVVIPKGPQPHKHVSEAIVVNTLKIDEI